MVTITFVKHLLHSLCDIGEACNTTITRQLVVGVPAFLIAACVLAFSDFTPLWVWVVLGLLYLSAALRLGHYWASQDREG